MMISRRFSSSDRFRIGVIVSPFCPPLYRPRLPAANYAVATHGSFLKSEQYVAAAIMPAPVAQQAKR